MKGFSHILIVIFSALILPAMFGGCNNNRIDETRREDARFLFKQITDATLSYSDSIRQAVDSATVNRLNTAFLKRLVTINQYTTPNTDLYLTISQNDSIAQLITVYDSLRKERLSYIATLDTIAQDSVANRPR